MLLQYTLYAILAEKEGFEPSMGVKAHTPLAGERLQPLGHLSTYRPKSTAKIRIRCLLISHDQGSLNRKRKTTPTTNLESPPPTALKKTARDDTTFEINEKVEFHHIWGTIRPSHPARVLFLFEFFDKFPRGAQQFPLAH